MKSLKTNATKGGKRVAIINDALLQIGAPLARDFAKQGYNLVLAQPAEGLVKECEGHGAKVIVVPGIEQHGPNDETPARLHPEVGRRRDEGIRRFRFRLHPDGGTHARQYLRYKCRGHAENVRGQLPRGGLCASVPATTADGKGRRAKFLS